MYRNKIWILFSIVIVSLVFYSAGCSSKNEESAIKEKLHEFNNAYQNKDMNKYADFFSKEYKDRINKKYPGGVEVWKKNFEKNYLSPYQSITFNSEVVKIDTSRGSYIVTEKINITGIDSTGNEKIIKQNGQQVVTFVKEDGEWKINNVSEYTVPEVYYKLEKNFDNKPGLAYVAHITHNFISVIDLDSKEVIGKIPAGDGTSDIAFSPDQQKGYISDFNANLITVFDIKTHETIDTIHVGKQPAYVLFTADGKHALVSHQSNDGLYVIDALKDSIIHKHLRRTGPLYLSNNGKEIYQPQIFLPYVHKINVDSFYIAKNISTQGRPMEMAFTPDNKFAYLTNYDLSSVQKIDLQLDSVVSEIENISSPRGIAAAPDGKTAYVTDVKDNTVTVLDLEKDKVIKTIEVGIMPTSVVVTRDGKFAYVTNQGDASISIINTADNKVTGKINVADNPIQIRIK